MSFAVLRPRLRTLVSAPVLAFVIAVVGLAGTPVLANDGDPGVARLSALRGDVDVKRADSGDTLAATVNAPVAVGDFLTTHGDARAEIEFDYGTVLRVAPDTQIRFTQLEPGQHRVQLAQGTIELHVARSLGAHAAVETPQTTIRPGASGSYRVTVTSDGDTKITTRAGRADVTTDSGSQTLEPGSTLLVAGTAANPDIRTLRVAADDDFERWNSERDSYLAQTRENTYVDEGLVGAGDLDSYGRWIDNPRYGRVWTPQANPGWAPYHDGRFVWEPYYGWTWVAAEPWGWAPYHYGNWFYAAGPGWCWYPGNYAFARPYVYRPALVAFFSFGGFGGGFGNIGWVPLAPFEPFFPWYGGGFYRPITVVNNITNITNVTIVHSAPTVASGNIFTIYHNSNAPGGAVSVAGTSFARGNFAHVEGVVAKTLVHASPIRGVVPIVPTAKSLALTDRAPLHAPSHGTTVEPFAHFAAPKVQTRPFAAEQADVLKLARATYPHETRMLERTPSTNANVTISPRNVLVAPSLVRSAPVMPLRPTNAQPPVTRHRENVFHPSIIERPVVIENSTVTSTRRVTPVHLGSPWDRFEGRRGVQVLNLEGGRGETFVRPTIESQPTRAIDTHNYVTHGDVTHGDVTRGDITHGDVTHGYGMHDNGMHGYGTHPYDAHVDRGTNGVALPLERIPEARIHVVPQTMGPVSAEHGTIQRSAPSESTHVTRATENGRAGVLRQ